jgi:hypothetical protein
MHEPSSPQRHLAGAPRIVPRQRPWSHVHRAAPRTSPSHRPTAPHSHAAGSREMVPRQPPSASQRQRTRSCGRTSAPASAAGVERAGDAAEEPSGSTYRVTAVLGASGGIEQSSSGQSTVAFQGVGAGAGACWSATLSARPTGRPDPTTAERNAATPAEAEITRHSTASPDRRYVFIGSRARVSGNDTGARRRLWSAHPVGLK